MGCCKTKDLGFSGDPVAKFKSYIETGAVENIRTLYKLVKYKQPAFDINSLRFKVDGNLEVSALGLSILIGNAAVFSIIRDEMNGSYALAEYLFSKVHTSGLSIICLNNYLLLLQSYLPLYLRSKDFVPGDKASILKSTLDLSPMLRSPTEEVSTYTPIHLACENGHISILNFFRRFTAQFDLVPFELDLEAVDETTGNNCALISCQANNFTMMKFLFAQCDADFKILNAYDENALNILAIGSSENRPETFKCLEFLVEKVGVDIKHNYKETLLMLQCDRSKEYFQRKLAEIGITEDLEILEEEAKIKLMKRTTVQTYDTGNRFTFVKMFPDLLNKSMTGNMEDIDFEALFAMSKDDKTQDNI